jgi:catalase
MNISTTNEHTRTTVALVRPPISRVVGIGGLLATIAGLFLYAGGWFTPHKLSPASMVDIFEYLNGVHAGFRRNHAKGVCVTGSFESNGNGQAISKALVFLPGRVPLVGRFAFSGGDPDAADSAQTVRSLAIQFKQSDGEEWRTGMVNIPVFLVNTPQAFHDFLLASSPDPTTGKQDPAAMPAFLAKHPETTAALRVLHDHPFSAGFGDSSYFGLHAFRFTNANGETVPVRWSVAPEQTFQAPTGPAPGKNFLFDALIAQIHSEPMRWHLILTVGEAGDPTAKAATQWPADRKQIDAGTLTIDTIESEDSSHTRDITFDPLVLPDGIAPSDDPLLSARSAAYSQSFRRRESEPKTPSAVSPMEVRK